MWNSLTGPEIDPTSHNVSNLIFLFGGGNAPGTFRLAVDVTLQPYKQQIALPILHEIVMFFKTIELGIPQIKQVLTLQQNAAVDLKRKNYFYQAT